MRSISEAVVALLSHLGSSRSPRNETLHSILFVDDEANVLEAFSRNLCFDFDVRTAQSGKAGLIALEAGAVPVVVSDMRMPEMDGATFLAEVRKRWPDTVRVLLTGYADLEAAIQAVNVGQIYRFLTKPCPPDQLIGVLKDCLRQYELIQAERELLEQTLAGSVDVLVEILSVTNPGAFSRAARLRRFVDHVLLRLDWSERWQYEIAAMLSQIGCVSLHHEVLDKINAGQALAEDEQRAYLEHPAMAEKLLDQIPRMSEIAQMIGGQQELDGVVDHPTNVRRGATLLQAALALDAQLIAGRSVAEAVQKLADSGKHPTEIIEALRDLPDESGYYLVKVLDTKDLAAGMVLEEDLRSKAGVLLAARGQEISLPMVRRLHGIAARGGTAASVRVRIKE